MLPAKAATPLNQTSLPRIHNDESGVARHDEQPRTKRSNWRVEHKFVVNETVAEQVRQWAAQNLDPDRHCDLSLGGEYRVSSLYLDTPNLDVYHRTKPTGRRKFRLRRYGSEDTIWLETKRKLNGLSRKRRTVVRELETPLLQLSSNPEWPGDWFRRRIETRLLRPVATVTYQRFARVGSTSDGDIRLTIDRDVRGTAASGWQVPRGSSEEIALLPESWVVELKFREVLPSLFKQLLCDLPLQAASFSKYRAAVNACGLVSKRIADAS